MKKCPHPPERMGAFRGGELNRSFLAHWREWVIIQRMSFQREKRLRIISYIGLGVLALATAIILVMVAQMPETVFVPRNGTGPQVNK